MNKLMTEADIDKAIEEIDEIVSKKLLELEQTENNLRAAVLAEREACAKLCESKSNDEYATGKVDHNEQAWTDSCAEAIRARSKHD